MSTVLSQDDRDAIQRQVQADIEAENKKVADVQRAAQTESKIKSDRVVIGMNVYDRATYEKMEGLAKWFVEKVTNRVMSEGTDTAGGYLVPDEYASFIVEKMKDLPFLTNLVSSIVVNSDTIKIPRQNASATVAITNEGSSITSSDASFTQITLTPYNLAGYVNVTGQLIEDAATNPGIVEFIVTDLVRAIGEKQDEYLVKGTGSSQPAGLLSEFKASGSNITIKNATDTHNTITQAQLDSVVDSMPTTALSAGECFWVCSKAALPVLRGVKNAAGVYAVTPVHDRVANPTIPNGARANMLGYPVYTVSDSILGNALTGPTGITASKAGAIFLVNGRNGLIKAERSGVNIATSDVAGNNFQKWETSVRVMQRFDCDYRDYNSVVALSWRAKA